MEAWQIILIVAIGIILILPYALFCILIKPNKYRSEMDAFKNVRYAHRGLHGNGVPENSMEAFKLAVDAGYGIELDVRVSSDGELMVFHDDTLDRMTNESGNVDARTKEELKKIKLLGTENTIPTFREVLELVGGKIPLLVEIKEFNGSYLATEKTAEILKEYKGPFIVESFNPLALGKLKKLAPEFMRGFLSQNFSDNEKYRTPKYCALKNMLFNFIARPDFIAYRHSDYDVRALKHIKKFYKKTPLIAWTVENSEDDALAVKNGFSGIIFQYYLPETTVSTERGN
jgi:glycerophosphoryl diester phosphodiesterase